MNGITEMGTIDIDVIADIRDEAGRLIETR